jgi:hypothetical protein
VDGAIVTQGIKTSVVSVDTANNQMVVDGGKWDTSNQSQVWSALLSASPNGFRSGNGPEMAFNGDIGNNAVTEDADGTLTLDLTGLNITGNVQVLYGIGNTGAYTVTINGANGPSVDTNNATSGDPNYTTPSANVGIISTIEITTTSGSQMNLKGVYIEGRLLVDAALDSQAWSANNTGYGASKPAASSFNGDTNNSSGFSMPAAKGTSCRVTFDPIPASKIEVYHLLQSGAPGISFDYYISDSQQRTVRDDNPEGWATLYDGAEIAVNGLGATASDIDSSGGIGGGHTAWRIDGKLLIDKGIRDFGDTEVRYQTKGGKGDIVLVDASNNTLRINDTGDSDNRWIAENKADVEFKIAGPSYVDSPLLTSHVELESSQFATTPAFDPNTGEPIDGLAKITWSLKPGNDAEYQLDAGTLNPYRPSGLQLNTTYTIKVKHTGARLGDSDWSLSTTFTTGASRTLNDHYMKQIKVLEEELREARSS